MGSAVQAVVPTTSMVASCLNESKSSCTPTHLFISVRTFPPPAGTVSLSSQREEDQQEEQEIVEGPALLGEAALLGAPRGFPCHLATLRTLTRCTLWRLDAADFAAALRMHPQVGGGGS